MKSLKHGLVMIIVTLAGFASLVLAQMPSGNRVNNSETIVWTGTSTNFTLAQTTQPVTPAQIELTFKTVGTTDFSFNYVRGAYTNIVINRSLTNLVTYIWNCPRDLKLVGNDKLMFTKSRGDQAQLTINWK